VVDDTELLLVFVEEVLSTLTPPLHIVTAASGVAGLEKAASEKPDLILLDYSLPDIKGDEICRRLLAEEKTARLPVVMMSGHVPEMLSVADQFENVIAAIPKPFLSTALLELIERTLKDLPAISSRRRKKTKRSFAPKAKPEPTSPKGTNSHAKQNGLPPVMEPTPPAVDEAASPAPKVDSPGVEPSAPAIENLTHAIELPEPADGAASPLSAPEIERASAPPVESPSPEGELPAVSSVPPPAAMEASSMQVPTLPHVTPAVVKAGKNAVILSLPLEVVSIQLSPSLQMKAIRARPFSATVSLHVLPQGVPGGVSREAVFELRGVNLDARGRIDTVRVAPSAGPLPEMSAGNAIAVVGLSLLPAASGAAIELLPAPAAPMRMQLTTLFELSGVELSPGFRVGHLILKWGGGKMRVSQQSDAAHGGVTFETAQLLLDRSGGIAEILLDAVA